MTVVLIRVGGVGRPTLVPALAGKKVASVATGSACSYAVLDNGATYAWGFGENLQLGTGDDEVCWLFGALAFLSYLLCFFRTNTSPWNWWGSSLRESSPLRCGSMFCYVFLVGFFALLTRCARIRLMRAANTASWRRPQSPTDFDKCRIIQCLRYQYTDEG